jgi:hypothetical protein
MINANENPVAWPLLLMQLDDAREHLEDLIQKMNEAGAIEESEFAVDLGHIYAHLNRVWHSRNLSSEITEEQWPKFNQFPNDLTPVG